MLDADCLVRNKQMSRRTFLGAAAGVAGVSIVGTAAGSHDQYRTVIDVVDAGIDNDASQYVSEQLEALIEAHDSVLLEFPPGRYLMDQQVFVRGFDRLGLRGTDATFVPRQADDFEGEARLFKLGTATVPGNWLEIRNVTFDFTGYNTGLRGLQAQVRDLWVENVTFRGRHDTGTWGPTAFDVVDSDRTGLVRNLSLDGGRFAANTPRDMTPATAGGYGPTGMIVGPDHRGTLIVENCSIGGFPSNGLYSSSYGGRVVVDGCRFRNSNVANLRLAGDGDEVRNTSVVVDQNRPLDNNQRGIRLDRGDDFHLANNRIHMPAATGEALRVTDVVGSATVEGLDVTFAHDDGTEDAISIAGDAGPVGIHNTDIEFRSGGQAVHVDEYAGTGTAPVILGLVSITGGADGGVGGAHAIRCERDSCEFWGITVDQPGDDWRRAMTITGDDCLIKNGRYESTHHAIVNGGDRNRYVDVVANTYNGYEGMKLLPETNGIQIRDSVVYGGIDAGESTGIVLSDNRFPSG